jgi:hypothetical protein
MPAGTADAEIRSSADFFTALTPLATPRDTFDETRYRPAPDDFGRLPSQF